MYSIKFKKYSKLSDSFTYVVTEQTTADESWRLMSAQT